MTLTLRKSDLSYTAEVRLLHVVTTAILVGTASAKAAFNVDDPAVIAAQARMDAALAEVSRYIAALEDIASDRLVEVARLSGDLSQYGMSKHSAPAVPDVRKSYTTSEPQ